MKHRTETKIKNIVDGVDCEMIAIKVKITKSLSPAFKIGDICIWDGVFLTKKDNENK